MERRWIYNATGGLQDLKWAYRFADYAWQALEYDEVVTYTITHDYNDRTSDYAFFSDGRLINTMAIGSDEYKTTEEAGYMFRLMTGVGGSTFAVRVYDRVLSEEEKQRNRAADLLYYYDVDPTLLDQCIAYGMDVAPLFSRIAELSFNMDREVAQLRIDSCLASSWLAYEGVGIHKDGKASVRYYFSLDFSSVAALENAGFSVELGVLANVDKGSLPLLNSSDYKVVAYRNGITNDAFFTDDSTCALTVRYLSEDKKTVLTDVLVRGYLRLTNADGEENVFYVSTDGDDVSPDSLFNVCYLMKENDGVKQDVALQNKVERRLEKCYEKVTVYAEAGAPAGGDGSVGAPYNNFADAYAACKRFLAKTNSPTRVVLLLRDGIYGIYETQVLSSSEMQYRHLSFEITSANGNSTLTTTKNIDEAFVKYADNIWMCQLEKEDGSYPDFRYLYVNGKIADLAYSGGRYVSDEGQFVTKFERDYDAIWTKANDMHAKGTLSESSTGGYPADRADLNLAFENYKTRFFALDEMLALYAAGSLAIDSVSSRANASDYYLAAFEEYKLWQLAYDELKAQYAVNLEGGAAAANALSACRPVNYPDNTAYNDTFNAIRIEMGNLGVTDFSGFSPRVKTTSIADGKYYLPLEIVGDLTEAITAGNERNRLEYEAILAQYNAADEAGKAELQDALDEAEKRVDPLTSVRYSLYGYGPAMHLGGQWWNNIIHVAGVDYGDTAQDSAGGVHVAVYLELEEYANYHVHKTYTMVGRYVDMKDALVYVDQAGEYFYDDSEGKLYYCTDYGVIHNHGWHRKPEHPTHRKVHQNESGK